MTKKRSTFEIDMEILEKSTKLVKPTYLLRSSNLSGDMFKERIGELKERGLIEEIAVGEEEFKRDKRTKIKYHTTAKGINIIMMQKEARKSID